MRLPVLEQIRNNLQLKYKHMHGGKAARRRYMEKRGLIAPKPTSFSRSEDGTRYEYNDRIASKFAGWSTVQRNAGKVPTFKEFYNQMEPDDKALVTATEVFKSN
jgi:hypothetical protein